MADLRASAPQSRVEEDAAGSPTSIFRWTPSDEPARVVSVDTDQWGEIFDTYDPDRRVEALAQIVRVCTAHKVRTVLIEQRYIDLDYRNEHAEFYSGTFRRYPSVCHRLHFFTSELSPEQALEGITQEGYCGYAVMRPLPQYPVGRTMLLPPSEVERSCVATDQVHLFGHTLQIAAVPFTSQDGQFTRCAHAVMWMVLYHFHKQHGLPRRLPSEIRLATQGGRVSGRELPSEGLSSDQMLSGLHSLSVSAFKSEIKKPGLGRDRQQRFADVLCPYINSQMPPLVRTQEHIWLVAGYSRAGNKDITYYIHDDERGPYIPVDDPDHDIKSRHPWAIAILPLPHKVYMAADIAELVGQDAFERRQTQLRTELAVTFGENMISTDGLNLLIQQQSPTDRPRKPTPREEKRIETEIKRFEKVFFRILGDRPDSGGTWKVGEHQDALIDALMLLQKRHLCRRTYAIPSQDFKAAAHERFPAKLAAAYRLAPWPRYVWVVEFLDHSLRASRDPKCVVGEVVLDATAHHLSDAASDLPVLSIHMGGIAGFVTADYENKVESADFLAGPYRSGAPSIRP